MSERGNDHFSRYVRVLLSIAGEGALLLYLCLNEVACLKLSVAKYSESDHVLHQLTCIRELIRSRLGNVCYC